MLLLIGGLFLSVIIGYLRGGRLGYLARLRINYFPLVLLAFLIQTFLDHLTYRGLIEKSFWTAGLHLLSYVLLFVFLWFNSTVPGMKVLGAGIFLNFIVILLNGGAMPVITEGLPAGDLAFLATSAIHQPLGPATRLAFLADVLVLDLFRPGRYSIGDLMIGIGIFLLVQKAMTVRQSNS
ncbi:DUF5317 domain-containing protein [Calderihabitans maritimus]|uniref:DUF5317 domain-containing protein n=1 Tax=Calderihabitans maritimus TaxID=1246530 RepID=UPI000B500DA2|nr:DUF5317 domain-containing protein [Calderihabitans maritimus]